MSDCKCSFPSISWMTGRHKTYCPVYLQNRIAALEAQLKNPITVTLPDVEQCEGRSFIIQNNGDRHVVIEAPPEPFPTKAQLLDRIAELESEKSCGELDLSLMDGMRQRIYALEKVAEAAEEVCIDLQLNEGTYYARLNDELIAAGYLKEQGE